VKVRDINSGLKALRREVVEELLERRALNASELAAIESRMPMHLWGIEDPDLYRENLQAFARALLRIAPRAPGRKLPSE